MCRMRERERGRNKERRKEIRKGFEGSKCVYSQTFTLLSHKNRRASTGSETNSILFLSLSLSWKNTKTFWLLENATKNWIEKEGMKNKGIWSRVNEMEREGEKAVGMDMSALGEKRNTTKWKKKNRKWVWYVLPFLPVKKRDQVTNGFFWLLMPPSFLFYSSPSLGLGNSQRSKIHTTSLPRFCSHSYTFIPFFIFQPFSHFHIDSCSLFKYYFPSDLKDR